MKQVYCKPVLKLLLVWLVASMICDIAGAQTAVSTYATQNMAPTTSNRTSAGHFTNGRGTGAFNTFFTASNNHRLFSVSVTPVERRLWQG